MGRRGRGGHLPVYAALRDTYDFVAVCDKDEDVLHEVVGEYSVNTYTSVRDLVEHEELDVADIVYPVMPIMLSAVFLRTLVLI